MCCRNAVQIWMPLLLRFVVVEQATAPTALVSCPVCEIPQRSGFVFHNPKALSVSLQSGRFRVAGWWIRSPTVCTVVCGRILFEVVRPHLTPLAGNVIVVVLLMLLSW